MFLVPTKRKAGIGDEIAQMIACFAKFTSFMGRLKNGIRGNSCTYVCYRLMDMYQKLKIS